MLSLLDFALPIEQKNIDLNLSHFYMYNKQILTKTDPYELKVFPFICAISLYTMS